MFELEKNPGPFPSKNVPESTVLGDNAAEVRCRERCTKHSHLKKTWPQVKEQADRDTKISQRSHTSQRQD